MAHNHLPLVITFIDTMKTFLLVVLYFLFCITHVLSNPPGENLETYVTNPCPICLEAMSDSDFIDRCGHKYHHACISDCLRKTPTSCCPLSRKEISDNAVIEKIMAAKTGATKQMPRDDHAPEPRISPAIESRIRKNDLLPAAFEAIRLQDIVARNVLCSLLLSECNLCNPEAADAEVMRHLMGRIEGESPMHYAARHGLLSFVAFLLDENFSINESNHENNTPLMLALDHGHVEIAMMLLERIGNVDQSNIYGDTPLHLAAKRGLFGIVKDILARSNCIDMPNMDGSTPLTLALENEHDEIAELILAKMNRRGQTNACRNTLPRFATGKPPFCNIEALLRPKPRTSICQIRRT